MDKKEYESLLEKSVELFKKEEYYKYLDALGRCYEFNSECFDDEVNVFRFSFSSYAVSKSLKLNEFNRFFPLLTKYLVTLESSLEKEEFLMKIIETLNNNFNYSLSETPVIYYSSFNNAAVVLDQEVKFLDFIDLNSESEDKAVSNSLITNIEKNIAVMKKIIRFSGSKYVANFIYLPSKPKKYLKELEEKIARLK